MSSGREAVDQKLTYLAIRTTLAESLVESGALEAVKRWLEPLPDKSLPAPNIQRPLFEILRTVLDFHIVNHRFLC